MKQLIFMLAMATTVFAAPFDPKDVAANPAVLFHLDCDALRASDLGKSILSEPDVQNKLTTVAVLFNFDLRTQLHGATIYTTETDPKEGVLVVYADFESGRLTALAKVANGSECTTNDSHVIYSWLDDKKKSTEGKAARVYGSILGHRVVFGRDESHVAAALDVIDHHSPDYSGKEGLPKSEAGESIIAEGVVLKFPFDTTDQNAAIFKMSKSAHLKLSEVSDHINGTLHLEAADADTASQISAIAHGLLALLKLQKTEQPALELANAIAIKQDGSAVTVSISLPTTDVLDTIKQKHEENVKKAQSTNSPAEHN